MSVNLKPVIDANRADALDLAPRIEQTHCVRPVYEALAKAHDEGGYGCAIYVGETMVGFFTLAEEGRRVWVSDFFIDQSFQRRGYAAAAVAALLETLSERGFTHVGVRLHPDNIAAEAVFAKHGFTPAGEGEGRELLYEMQLAAD